jgi:hypothetical protein
MKQLDLVVWGPAMWRALHAVSFTPDRGGHLKFFESVPDALPCPSCGVHLREIYAKLPIDVSSTKACSEWLWKVHNEVNASLKKPSYSYEDLVKEYMVGVEDAPDKKINWMVVVGVILALLGIVVFILKRNKCLA